MTWKEFKRYVESNNVKDDEGIESINYDSRYTEGNAMYTVKRKFEIEG